MKKFLFLFTSFFIIGCTDTTPPQVVSLNPAIYKENVDTSLREITLTFSEPMMNGGWSFVYKDETLFPTLSGEPWYSEDLKTVYLPVDLQPGKTYEIWLNSEEFSGFQDQSGNALVPYLWTFSTKE